MKNHYIILAVIISMAVSFLTSCKKLIEIPPNPISEIPNSAMFADSSSIMSAWAGIYVAFGPSQRNFYSANVTIATGLTSDELAVPANSLDITLLNNTILNTNGTAASNWRDAYKNLFRINSCLENIDGTNVISQTLKNQLIGEAKVARAYTYLHLVNLYGGVPVVTTTDYQVNKALPRASADAVYDQILADLNDAKRLLMNDYPSEGRARPNKMVASALLARVYLYRGQWNNAELAAGEIINSGAYSLANLAEIFLKGSNEAIWQLPSNGTFAQTAEGFTFVANPFNSRVPAYYLSPFMLASFDPADLRMTQWTGVKSLSGTNYIYPAKYKQRTLEGAPAEDYVLIRLAEMYLIRAEALAHQGKTTDAIADLNKIRNPERVGLPVYSGPVAEADIVAAVMRERRIELFCEGGHRWYDLKRTGTIDQVLGAEKPNWQSTDALFPVPATELILNPFLVQNPGYE